MVIRRLYLFKTPLDNSYINVIDINDISNEIPKSRYKSKLFDILVTHYSLLGVVGVTGRSIKIENNKSFLSLPKKYEEIRDYNYCVIDSSPDLSYPDLKFFFVTDLKSENDSDENPSCSMTLTWDSWSNNIGSFEYDRQDLIQIGHSQRFEFTGLDLANFNPRFDKLYVNEYIDELVTSKKDLYTATSDDEYDVDNYSDAEFLNNVKPLFLVLEVDDFNHIKDSIEVESEVDALKHPFPQSFYLDRRFRKDLLYIPIALVDIFKNKIVDGTFSGDSYSFNYSPEGGSITVNRYSNPFRVTGSEMIGGELDRTTVSSYIRNAWYTFFSPFDYEIFQETTIPLLGVYKRGIRFKNVILGTINLTEVWKFTKVPIIINEEIAHINPLLDIDTEFSFTKVDIKNLLHLQSVTDFTNKKYLNTEFEEPILKTFPFNYISYNIKNDKHNIVSLNNEIPLYLEVKYKMFNCEPILYFYINENQLLNSNGYLSRMGGMITKSVDAQDDYRIRNGSQHDVAQNLKYARGVTKAFGSAASVGAYGAQENPSLSLLPSAIKSVFGFIEGVTDVIGASAQEAALYEDLRRTPDSITGSYGENDIIYNDRPSFMFNTVINENNIKEIKNNRKMFGEKYLRYNSAFNNNRIFFDYVKVVNCNLEFIKNTLDREVINTILTRGTFKNHITFTNQHDYYFNNSLSKNVVNNEITFLTTQFFNYEEV